MSMRLSMRSFVLGCAGVLLIATLPAQTQNNPASSFSCPVSSTDTSLPQFTNALVNGDLVFLNSRVEPTQAVFWTPPKNKVFILTDIVVQNRAPGDEPVTATQFTRFTITSPTSNDVFFTVFSNTALSEHFKAGLPITTTFRFLNVINSNAPFVEVFITGVLRDCGKKD